MTDLRLIPIQLSDDAWIYVEYRNQPHFVYAVMLQVRVAENRRQTIRLYDNAHGANEMHRYTGTEKQPAEPFFADHLPRRAMPAAIDYLEENWEKVLDEWTR